MSFDIYSIGDAAFLYEILNGIAALFGSNNYATLIKLAFVVGFLSMIVGALRTGGAGVNIMRPLLAFVMYSVAVGPTATVVVQNVYTAQVYTVANVPIGIALMGSLFSKIGYNITKQMETAFSSPSMTQEGFASALETVIRVRQMTSMCQNAGTSNSPTAGSDACLSWQNYIKECTLRAIINGQSSFNAIANAPDPIAALYVNNQTMQVEVMIGGAPQTGPCSTIFTPLVNWTKTVWLSSFEANVLAPKLNVATSAAAMSKIQDALTAIGTTSAANDFVLASWVIPIYLDSAASTYQDDYKWSYATMIDQAQRERNVAWEGSRSLFERYVQPMLTVLEGMFYALAPLVVALTVIGFGSIGTFAKFAVMGLAIQLWMPLLSIVNLFEHTVVAGKLDALAASGLSINSMGGVFQSNDIIQTWLSVGGAIASTVPALAIGLLYGGGLALNGLGEKIGAQETINPKQGAPETSAPYSRTYVMSQQTVSPSSGVLQTGAESTLGDFNIAVTRSRNSESSARESLVRSGEITGSFGDGSRTDTNTGRTVADGVAATNREDVGFARSTSASVDTSSGARSSFGSGTQLDDSTIVSGSVSGSVRGSVAAERGAGGGGAGGGGRGGAGGASVSASAGADVSTSVTATSGTRRSADSAIETRAAFNENVGGTTTRGSNRARDESSSDQRTGSIGASHGTHSEVTRSGRSASNNDRGFTDSSSLGSSGGFHQSVPAAVFTHDVLSNPAARAQLAQAVDQMGIGGAVNQALTRQVVSKFGGNVEAARTYTALKALEGANPYYAYSPGSRAFGQDALSQIYGTTQGTGAGQFGDSYANRGIADAGLAAAPLIDNVFKAINAGRSEVQAGIRSTGHAVNSGDMDAQYESDRLLPSSDQDVMNWQQYELVAAQRRASTDYNQTEFDQSSAADIAESRNLSTGGRTLRAALPESIGGGEMPIAHARAQQALDMGINDRRVAQYYGLASIPPAVRSPEATAALDSLRPQLERTYGGGLIHRLDNAAQASEGAATLDLRAVKQQVSEFTYGSLPESSTRGAR